MFPFLFEGRAEKRPALDRLERTHEQGEISWEISDSAATKNDSSTPIVSVAHQSSKRAFDFTALRDSGLVKVG